ncbi:MAG: DUF1501 domain-containing protein [Pirellulaceae bacterium]|nr:DUF1501 domain-containing protein [Pirellulaceae bacterium]
MQRATGLTRRHFVRLGSLAVGGLGLADWLRLRAGAAHAGKPPSARQCILIWLDGGPSHLETFDLKPQAPAEVRGPFRPIATAVPGIEISEFLPRTASRMRDIAVVRSVTSPLGEHNFGAHYLQTGYKPTPALEYPSLGSVLAHVRHGHSETPPVLPGHLAVPEFRVGGGRYAGHGFLPEAARPFPVGGDPARPDFQVRDLDFFPGTGPERVQRRREFVEYLDRMRRGVEQDRPAGGGEASLADPPASDAAFQQAYRLVMSPEAREAFQLEREADAVRQRYGGRTIGQSCLLARRLIERGVPFVTVNYPGWDTHQDLVTRLKEGYTGARVPVGLIPSLDLALAALLEDLSDRGLLNDTLVVVMGEFGRTPKLNTSAGRDHWPRVFSVAMAGGGIAGGQVVGSSDSLGESPRDAPCTPADLAATIYHLLGVPLDTLLHTPDGRPIQVVRDGRVISRLIA